MKAGDVVLVPLPQADHRVKNRPAIVLRTLPPHDDLLVCGVSTQLRHEVAGFDDVIRPGDADFEASGLKAASLIRLGFLAVLPPSTFTGTLGSISPSGTVASPSDCHSTSRVRQREQTSGPSDRSSRSC